MKDRFVSCGLPATFVDDLQQSIARFEEQLDGRTAGKTGGAVSKAAIQSAPQTGGDTVASLDAFVTNALGADETAMADWRTTRRIEAVVRNPTQRRRRKHRRRSQRAAHRQ